MGRHVPELALVTGGLLALSLFFVSLLFTGDVSRTILAAVAVFYVFAAYAVSHGDDPTTVLPPRPVLALAGIFAVAVVQDVTLRAAPFRVPAQFLLGLFLGLLVFLPAAAYYVRYGSPLNPLSPRATVVVAAVVGPALLTFGLVVGASAYGAADGLLVALAGAVYARVNNLRLTRRVRRLVVLSGAVFGSGVVVVGIGLQRPLGDFVVVGTAAALGPSVYYALTAEER